MAASSAAPNVGRGSRCVTPLSEDCLYLNVWTAAQTTEDALPVFIWFHGGGLFAGCGNKNPIDGEGFARRGVIFVSVNYRLNVFGFLSHPELTAEDEHHSSGNYGTLDQIAAIHWVKENIRAFGGDPDHITIGGQSGGAYSVQALAVSPLAKGLFQQVAIHSGGGRRLDTVLFPYDLKKSEEYGVEFLELLGVSNIAQARTLSQEELVAAYKEHGGKFRGWNSFRPNTDGYVFGELYSDAFFSGKIHPDLKFLIGVTNGEGAAASAGGSTMASLYGGAAQKAEVPFQERKAALEREIRELFGDYADEYLALAALEDSEALDKYVRDDLNDHKPAYSWAMCESLCRNEYPAPYAYFFDQVSPGGDMPAAFHSSDLPYLFQSLLRNHRAFTGGDFEISNRSVLDKLHSVW